MRAQKRKPPPARPAGTVHNAEVAAAFEEIADLLAIEDESPFRVRAYRNAARVIGELGREVAAMVASGEDLTALPGIGKDLAAKIRELVVTGELDVLRALRERTPPALTALLRLPGLGPKRVRALYATLGVRTVDELRAAAEAKHIREIPGFGEKTEARILQALAANEAERGRFPLASVSGDAEALVRWLSAAPSAERVTIAGSYRRGRETVGDLDILVSADEDADAVMDRFVSYEAVARVTAEGPTRAAAVLKSGIAVDVRVVPRASFGAALHYFTGSKAHNIAVRRMGQDRGLKINEYGVFRGEDPIAGDTEESVYASVDLPYIEPELREDRGELEAAREGRLPDLVRLEDLRGDLHAHSTATDGRDTVRVMAEAARARGLTYLAMTEHSRRLRMVHGLDPAGLRRTCAAIDRLNETLTGIVVLKGIEVDILEDGSLDLPDDVLGELDLVVGAVHSRFDLPRAAQTERILRAMDRPSFSILAHPSARLVQRRAPIDIDMIRIIRHAKERGCFMELDAQPDRLDLTDVHARLCRDEGVLVAVSSDAHRAADLAGLRFGVIQARRGWLSKSDVLNTRTLPALKRLLRRTMRQR
ncbi:DNA polymerase X family protein [Minicystis rosea]|nr:DNA polymerase X family protein [Minicystis rosea]